MRHTTTALALSLLLAAAPAAAQHFGAPMPAGEALPVAQALAQAEGLEGQTVKLQGRITEVCQKTGCWVVLDAGGTPVRVRTEHVFFVPKDASGMAVVFGEWKAVEPSAEQAQHYVDDGSGESKLDREWQILATSILIES